MWTNIISPGIFTPNLYTLSLEYFEVTLGTLILLLLCCGVYIARHRRATKMSIAVYILMLLLMCILFTVVSIKDEQIEENQTSSDERRACPEYEYVVNGNRIDIYERFPEQL